MIKPLLALAAALVGFAGTVHAATKPSFRVEPASVSETALLVPIRIDKSAVASSYSKVSVRTVDGTAKAGVDYTPISTTVTFSNSALWWSVPVAVIARPGYQGNRSFTVHIAAVRNATIAQADAAVTILESEQPPAPPPTPTTWVTAPLTNGGYARCKTAGGCHSTSAPCPQGLNPPAVCSYPDIIAQFGDVWMYAWNGCDWTNPCRYTGAFWPVGQYKVAGVGVEGRQDEWEGVVPSP